MIEEAEGSKSPLPPSRSKRVHPPSSASRPRLGRFDGLVLSRWALVVCQAATILVTWRLWDVRTSPPMLPAFDLPQIPVGWPLLVSLLLVFRFPLHGAIAHAVIVLYALAADQTRMQPEIMSMAFLLLGVGGPAWLLFLGRIHLLTLWGWAGLNKLLSPSFMTETGPWMFDGLFFHPPSELAQYFGALVIFLELGAGVAGVFPDLRKYSAAMAVMLHMGALLILGPLGRNWNSSIWPWNIALAVCALALIAPWTDGWRAQFAAVPPATRALAILLVLYPALFYLGQVDAYLSHHLYSADTIEALVCNEKDSCTDAPFQRTLDVLNVPLPPQPRLLRAVFGQTCRPGERLELYHRRLGAQGPAPPEMCPRR